MFYSNFVIRFWMDYCRIAQNREFYSPFERDPETDCVYSLGGTPGFTVIFEGDFGC